MRCDRTCSSRSSARRARRQRARQPSAASVLSTQQSAVSLPKDCAIVATVAASRLAPTGVWTRIIFVTFLNPADGKKYCHALTVWQPATSKIVCIYDANGTFDLATESHEPAAIAAAYAQLARVLILEAHFI